MGADAADEAADSGSSSFDLPVIDARRNFSGGCGRWYPVILTLHRFFIAISMAVVDHVGGDGTALDPLVWSVGALPKRRRLVHAVRDHAFLPGPSSIWEEWVTLASAPVTAAEVGAWPYSVGILVNWVAFSGFLTLACGRCRPGSGERVLLIFSFCVGFGLVRDWS